MPMETAIIVSVVSGLFTVICTLLTVASGNRKISAELHEHNSVQDTKLDALTKQVEKHNSIIERTYRLEGRVDALEKQIGGNQ